MDEANKKASYVLANGFLKYKSFRDRIQFSQKKDNVLNYRLMRYNHLKTIFLR